LFVSELMLGTGHTMNFKWVIDGTAETGDLCNAQGQFKFSALYAGMM
jgi:hypothetical protein